MAVAGGGAAGVVLVAMCARGLPGDTNRLPMSIED